MVSATGNTENTVNIKIIPLTTIRLSGESPGIGYT
jgi:hypothetical protein